MQYDIHTHPFSEKNFNIPKIHCMIDTDLYLAIKKKYGQYFDNTADLPTELTAENGAKAALSGEFTISIELQCPECKGEGEVTFVHVDAIKCSNCTGSGIYTHTIYVPWTTIKEIYAKAVIHFKK